MTKLLFARARSAPASATGARFVTVTITASLDDPPQPSATTRENAYAPEAIGVNVGIAVSKRASATGGTAVWTQEYVRGSPSASLLSDPFNATKMFLSTLWSGPASAMGGRFSTSIMTVSTSFWFEVSHTVKVTSNDPRVPYQCGAVTPEAPVPSPKSHRYSAIPMSSVEADASKVIMSPMGATVGDARATAVGGSSCAVSTRRTCAFHVRQSPGVPAFDIPTVSVVDGIGPGSAPSYVRVSHKLPAVHGAVDVLGSAPGKAFESTTVSFQMALLPGFCPSETMNVVFSELDAVGACVKLSVNVELGV